MVLNGSELVTNGSYGVFFVFQGSVDVNLKSASLDSGLPRQLIAMNIKSFGRIREKCCILMQLYFKPGKGCENHPEINP